MTRDSARTQQAVIGGLEIDCVVTQEVHKNECMEIQQGVTRDVVNIDKDLRKDAVGHNNERARNQQ
eukprot:444197-Alexandrium_andersonii.AAC.1